VQQRPARSRVPTGSGFLAFLASRGIFHILGGFDHVLFVIALVSVVASWSQLAKVVTSFTAAHSITLALGALELVRISPRLVEPLIAASILYVGLENVFRESPRARLGVTFGFGLVHGFGFSGVLRDLGLARAQLAPALVGFNLGVEIGQLMIVAPLAPLVWLLRRRGAAYRTFRVGANACVALVAAWWFVQRVSGH
jgi:hydrogenase/urease accessory protein HupE